MCYVFVFKQKTAYEMRISDWSSDVCSSDLRGPPSPLLHGIELGEITGNKETAVPRGNDFHSINGSRALSPRASRPPEPQSGHSLSRRGSTKRRVRLSGRPWIVPPNASSFTSPVM